MTRPSNERDIYQRIVLGLPTPARMATAMVSIPPAASVSRRWGTVDAINGNGTLDVNVGGIIIPGARKVASYVPTIGETVMLDVVGGDIVVVNTLTPSPSNDFNTRLNSLSTTVTGYSGQLGNLPIKIIAVTNQQLPEGAAPGLTDHVVTISGARSMPSTDYVVSASSSERPDSTQGYGAAVFTVAEQRSLTKTTFEVRVNSTWNVALPLFISYTLTAVT